MKNILRNTILSLVIGSFVVLPAYASADSDKGKKEKGRTKIEARLTKEHEKNDKSGSENKEKNEKRSNQCIRAWGHLIAFGWLRKNVSVDVDLDNCYLPFGISKKLQQNNGSTTPADITAPTISNVRVFTGHTNAIIAWETDENTSGKVYFSLTSPVSTSTATSTASTKGLQGKSHFVALSKLGTSTTYYFIIEARDKAGNTKTSNQSSFATKPASIPVDTTAPIINGITVLPASTTITVSWSTNEPSTSKVYISSSTPINTLLSPFVLSGLMVTNHSVKIEGLSSSTSYYLVVESKNSANLTTSSTQFSTNTTAQ